MKFFLFIFIITVVVLTQGISCSIDIQSIFDFGSFSLFDSKQINEGENKVTQSNVRNHITIVFPQKTIHFQAKLSCSPKTCRFYLLKQSEYANYLKKVSFKHIKKSSPFYKNTVEEGDERDDDIGYDETKTIEDKYGETLILVVENVLQKDPTEIEISVEYEYKEHRVGLIDEKYTIHTIVAFSVIVLCIGSIVFASIWVLTYIVCVCMRKGNKEKKDEQTKIKQEMMDKYFVGKDRDFKQKRVLRVGEFSNMGVPGIERHGAVLVSSDSSRYVDAHTYNQIISKSSTSKFKKPSAPTQEHSFYPSPIPTRIENSSPSAPMYGGVPVYYSNGKA